MTSQPSESAPTRVNARLDERQAAKVAYLRRITGLATSEIIKRGIELLYEDVRRGGRAPFEVLTETGFIGCGEGPADLSERYKEHLHEVLADKHGDR